MLKNRAEKQHCLSENKTDAYLQKEKQQKKLENADRQRGLLKSRKRLQGSRQVNAAIRKLHKQKITAVKQANNHSGGYCNGSCLRIHIGMPSHTASAAAFFDSPAEIPWSQIEKLQA